MRHGDTSITISGPPQYGEGLSRLRLAADGKGLVVDILPASYNGFHLPATWLRLTREQALELSAAIPRFLEYAEKGGEK